MAGSNPDVIGAWKQGLVPRVEPSVFAPEACSWGMIAAGPHRLQQLLAQWLVGLPNHQQCALKQYLPSGLFFERFVWFTFYILVNVCFEIEYRLTDHKIC